MSYATLSELQSIAPLYGVAVPADDEAQRALDLASHDLDVHLLGVGAFDDLALALLTATQLDALTDACAIQATFRIAQGGDENLGTDDGVASLGPVSFSTRTPARISPEAVDRLAGLGLMRRAGTVAPDPPPTPDPFWPPWPLP